MGWDGDGDGMGIGERKKCMLVCMVTSSDLNKLGHE